MKKRGQSSQTTFYLFSFIMIAVILFVGIRLSKGTQAQVDKDEFIQFERDLQADLNTISTSYGTRRVITRTLPLEYTEVCFVDTKHVNPNLLISRPLMKANVESGVGDNVFMYSDDTMNTLVVTKFVIEEPYFFCIDDKQMGILATGDGENAVLQAQPDEGYCQTAQNDGICNGLNYIGTNYKDNCCASYGLCCGGAS